MIEIENAYFKLVAMSYTDELKGAIIAQRMGDSEAYHRLTDYVMEATQCELWELVEALDIVNNEAFAGENPFSKRLEIAENMAQIAKDERKKADDLHNIHARKDWDAIRKMHNIEGKILKKQESKEHWL